MTSHTNDQHERASTRQQSGGASFLAIADTVVHLFNPQLAQPAAAPLPGAFHQFVLGIHQRWLDVALGDGWAAPYANDVWTLHLREAPIIELKRYLYSRNRATYRGCCKVALAGRPDGQYGTLWCTMQYVPSVATKTSEVVVGGEWEAGAFFGARAFSRGAWPDRYLAVLEPVLLVLAGVPGLEAAIRTSATLDSATRAETADGAPSDDTTEALSIIDRARRAIATAGGGATTG
jgi:hypothetical protein